MKKILSAMAIATAFVAMPAAAQGYIGLGFGSSKVSGVDGPITGAGIPAGTNLTGGNTSKGIYKLYGGYQFTPNWGLELQYSDLGSRDLAARNAAGAVVVPGSLKASQFSVAGTGTLPLGANFSLLGKVGVTSNHLKLSLPGVSDKGSQTSLLLGVGVAYNITPALAVRVEYEDFGKLANGDGFGGAIRGNAYSVSLKYAF